MADTKISNLPPATIITGAEKIPAVQAGQTVQFDATDLATFVGASFDPAGSASTAETNAKNHSDVNDIATLAAANAYADSINAGNFNYRGTWAGTGNLYPTTGGTGVSGAIKQGNAFEISTACTINGIDYDQGDLIVAKVDTPGQTVGNWGNSEHNTQQATELSRGTGKVITQITVEDDTTTNDTDFVTGKKFWQGLTKFFTLKKDTSGGFVGLTLFKINFRNAANTFTSFFQNTNTAARTYIFQDRNGTIADDTDLASKASLTGTETLTNKRITKRTGTIASSATPSINTDNVDYFAITALNTAITSMTTNLSGTPTENQLLWISITDSGTPQSINWGPAYEGSLLPTITIASTRIDVGLVRNTVNSKWRCVAVNP